MQQKISKYWDLHVISLAADTFNRLYHVYDKWCPAVYTLLEPIPFNHPIVMHQRLRGSGRLEAMSGGFVEEHAFYLMIDLSAQYGLANRLQTLAFWATFCSMHQAGMYVLWEPKEACDCTFNEIFEKIKTDIPPFDKIPFITILDDPNESFWKAPKSHQYFCLGTVRSQCEYRLALGLLKDSMEATLEREPTWAPLYEKPIDLVKQYMVDDTSLWSDIFSLQPDILDEFDEYKNRYMQSDREHSAIHVRRGDWKYMNCTLKMEDPKLSRHERTRIKQMWEDADHEVEALNVKPQSYEHLRRTVSPGPEVKHKCSLLGSVLARQRQIVCTGV
jgi:hypothetical protein